MGSERKKGMKEAERREGKWEKGRIRINQGGER